MKKTIAVLILVLSLFLSSCSNRENTSSSAVESETTSSLSDNSNDIVKNFSLPYFSSDSLNPYSAKQTVNFSIGTLLYDSLVSLDENFNIKYVIAEKITCEKNILTVELKKNIKFSDASVLTAADVISSLNAARSCSYYSERLKNIDSAKIDEGKIVIKLRKSDFNFAKNLIFPITKSGSKENNAPGSGRYVLDMQSTPMVLKKNTFSSQPLNIEEIKLVEIKKYSTLQDMIKIGSINFAYYNVKKTLTVETESVKITTNNLVYIGVNAYNRYLSNANFRKAVSLATDRTLISSNAYANKGNITALAFNPKHKDLTSSYVVDSYNIKKAQEVLATIGLTQKDEENHLLYTDGTPISLKILVSSTSSEKIKAAEILRERLISLGIKSEIIKKSFEDYKSDISSGNYELYIGEIKLIPSNDITPVINKNALNDGGAFASAYQAFLSGDKNIEDFDKDFDMCTPFIPILYLNKTAVSSRSVKGNKDALEYDVFYGISNWKM